MISKATIEEIRARNEIAELIGSYITLQKSSGAFKALCPFHKEKTPSFHVNPQRQIFHCFGCDAGGDVFRFVMQYENVDFMGAVRLLAERASITIEDDRSSGGGGDPRDARRIKDRLYAIHEDVATLYQHQIAASPAAQAARDYLDARSLGADARRDFRIGYAPEAWDFLVAWGRAHHATPEELEQAGLVIRNETGRVYDRFRHRVTFAICNEQSRVIGFSARILVDDKQQPKYVNSPETPLFTKSKVLFALHRARAAILDRREAIVCEGQIDVIRCHLAGFTAAVAAQGTAFTEDHARTLKRYADTVRLVFDGDEAGRRAALRTAGICLQAGLAVRVTALPPGDDPDSFLLRQGADAFRAALEGAVPALDFQIQTHLAGASAQDEAAYRRATEAALDFIALATNATQREELLMQAARRLYVAPEALRAELLPRLRRAEARPAASAVATPAAPPEAAEDAPEPEAVDVPLSPDENALAEELVARPALAAIVGDFLPLEIIRNARCRAFVDAVLAAHAAGDDDFMRVVRERDDPEGRLGAFAAAVASAPSKPMRESSPERPLREIVLRLWRTHLTERRRALAAADGADADRAQLTHDLSMLRRWDTGEAVIRMHMG